MPLFVKCGTCGKEFRTKPFFVKRGGGKYCSKECHYKGLKTGKVVKCFICGKETYKSQKNLRHSKSKKYFCGKSCQAIWRNTITFVGKNHANWKDGRATYKTALKRSSAPKVCGLCKTKDTRLLAVHHIDHNRRNNDLKNLAWLCHNCHFLVHHYEKERKQFMETLVY